MAELSKTEEERNQEAIELGNKKMMEFAKKAKDVIEEHELKDMLGGAYRFLGRATTYAGDHLKASEYYEAAIQNYSGNNLKSKLEVNGYLAESLVRLGQTQKGLDLAMKTYNDFHDAELGQNLKKEDYFTWAVWMSGIAPRICVALLETNAEFDKEKLITWLKQIKTELTNPSGEITWGDHNFKFRMDEITFTLERLALVAIFPLILVATFRS